ncbi:MAG: allophanate hydrolase subunit 1, partial [Hyphomonadaceae bacterium]|nr:allophanate hydrolase subunit 1 [Hyphomonadaceae bacterium]
MVRPPQIIPYGDSALLMQFMSDGYSRDVIRTVQAMSSELRADPDWIEVVSGYDSLLLEFDPLKLDPVAAEGKLINLVNGFKPGQVPTGRLVEIPVYYGGKDGPDMQLIMDAAGLGESEVISLHSAREYLVCMMGFIPGFAFLSAAHDRLYHPRHETPRGRVPAGSVGIGGWQT